MDEDRFARLCKAKSVNRWKPAILPSHPAQCHVPPEILGLDRQEQAKRGYYAKGDNDISLVGSRKPARTWSTGAYSASGKSNHLKSRTFRGWRTHRCTLRKTDRERDGANPSKDKTEFI